MSPILRYLDHFFSDGYILIIKLKHKRSVRMSLIDVIVKLVIISFFITSLYSVLSASDFGYSIRSEDDSSSFGQLTSTLLLKVRTDDFPQETQWSLIDGNTYELIFSTADRSPVANTLYLDTIEVQQDRCLRFNITDTKGDGFSGDGFFEVILNGDLISVGTRFGDRHTYAFNCNEGLVCEEPIQISSGTELLKKTLNTWMTIRPIFDTYYDIRTISDCDTKLWLYDNCNNVNPNDQTGAILFNDDLEDKNAGFVQILLKGGDRYFLRVGVEGECLGDSFIELTDLKLKAGCMDPTSCNFDPLANIESGDCIYESCHPDLAINQEVLLQSTHLDVINNDSECLIVEGCLQGYGQRDIIRFTTEIQNLGNADYIVGEPAEDSRLFSEDNCHQHWHYLGYAEYLLYDGLGSPLPIGFKNGFCALDFRCDDDRSYKYNCDYMGISAGCSDTYESDLLCQWIDVTDVPDGNYTLVVRVNHRHAPDLFGRIESDFQNNSAQICISLNRSTGSPKLEILESCPSYTDCLGYEFGNALIDCNGVCGGIAHYGDINDDGKVDDQDTSEYRSKMKDGSLLTEPCYDLDGDHEISIYDLTLLSNCLINNPYNELDPTHTHCDFPKSIQNTKDSVVIMLRGFNKEERYIQLDYRSNTSISAIDLEIDGIVIERVEVEIESSNWIDLSNDDRLLLYTNDTDHFLSKSLEMTDLAKVYIKETQIIETCLIEARDIINDQNEKVNAVLDKTCLELNTTSINDSRLGKVVLFPNPTSTSIALDYPIGNKPTSWTIIDLTGNIQIQSAQARPLDDWIDLSRLSPGMYLMRLDSPSGSQVSSFIKL